MLSPNRQGVHCPKWGVLVLVMALSNIGQYLYGVILDEIFLGSNIWVNFQTWKFNSIGDVDQKAIAFEVVELVFELYNFLCKLFVHIHL